MANTISDKLTYLEGTKSAIKDAIVAKGVAVSDSDTFRSYADKIGQISGGGGGKVNLNDYGLTFANATTTTEQYNNIEYTLPNNMPSFFRDAKFPETIDISNKINLDTIYSGEYAFENATNVKIDNIKFDASNSYSFSSFKGTIVNIELVNQYSPSWAYSTRTFFSATSIPSSIKITNIQEDGTTSLQFFFYSTNNENGIIPEVEVVNGQLSLYYYFSSSYDYMTRVEKIKLTNATLSENLGNTAICGTANSYVTYFGGIEGADKSFSLFNFRALNSESITDIINGVLDLTGKDPQTITFHSTIFNAITEEQKALATSKNWTLASA